MQPLDLCHDRVVLFLAGLVDPVGLVQPTNGPVRRDHVDVESIDLVELGLLGLGGAGHARELVVHSEIVLDRDGGERLGLAFDLNAFLGLHRLVQSIRPAPPRHDPASELVDDHHLAFLHQVVDFLVIQNVSLQQLVDDVQLFALDGVVGLDLPAPLDALRGREIRMPIDRMNLFGDVGHQE
jgi:hypothetical protein